MLVGVVTVLESDGDGEPFTARVHVLTSRTESFPCASFTGVRMTTQVTVTVPIGLEAWNRCQDPLLLVNKTHEAAVLTVVIV